MGQKQLQLASLDVEAIIPAVMYPTYKLNVHDVHTVTKVAECIHIVVQKVLAAFPNLRKTFFS